MDPCTTSVKMLIVDVIDDMLFHFSYCFLFIRLKALQRSIEIDSGRCF